MVVRQTRSHPGQAAPGQRAAPAARRDAAKTKQKCTIWRWCLGSAPLALEEVDRVGEDCVERRLRPWCLRMARESAQSWCRKAVPHTWCALQLDAEEKIC